MKGKGPFLVGVQPDPLTMTWHCASRHSLTQPAALCRCMLTHYSECTHVPFCPPVPLSYSVLGPFIVPPLLAFSSQDKGP